MPCQVAYGNICASEAVQIAETVLMSRRVASVRWENLLESMLTVDQGSALYSSVWAIGG
ncbi:MAG TPA: hypothetical protein VNY78_06630 [Edaphobacter sp.]|nr:hypothetical protein [Edaphobacter sp.]